MKSFQRVWVLGISVLAISFVLDGQSQKAAQASGKQPTQAASSKAVGDNRPDIVTAVKAASVKDCGCGACAAMGCGPCHGKNCYYCVAKALVAKDCSCKGCNAKGCQSCGPGCDVCKFHLAPNANANATGPKRKE